MKSTTKRIKLDWNKLFGFNQVKSAQAEPNTRQAKAMIGAKIGAKPGMKPVRRQIAGWWFSLGSPERPLKTRASTFAHKYSPDAGKNVG